MWTVCCMSVLKLKVIRVLGEWAQYNILAIKIISRFTQNLKTSASAFVCTARFEQHQSE